ncbi:type IV conjugative transfer system protein TraL [Thorsellia kenyensis]|uniref:Type IV conjugative transfer system protein TraL n=1 Tax=Thorsellia kenyensis TaxID=1549888 RepID=A0ABV6CDA8_9GAMM
MTLQLIEIPSYIDEPPHFLLWSADEMAPILLGLVLGIFIEQAFVLTALGLVFTKLYRRFRNGKPDGYLLHYMYWKGVLPLNAKSIPNPFVRSYYP